MTENTKKHLHTRDTISLLNYTTSKSVFFQAYTKFTHLNLNFLSTLEMANLIKDIVSETIPLISKNFVYTKIRHFYRAPSVTLLLNAKNLSRLIEGNLSFFFYFGKFQQGRQFDKNV